MGVQENNRFLNHYPAAQDAAATAVVERKRAALAAHSPCPMPAPALHWNAIRRVERASARYLPETFPVSICSTSRSEFESLSLLYH